MNENIHPTILKEIKKELIEYINNKIQNRDNVYGAQMHADKILLILRLDNLYIEEN